VALIPALTSRLNTENSAIRKNLTDRATLADTYRQSHELIAIAISLEVEKLTDIFNFGSKSWRLQQVYSLQAWYWEVVEMFRKLILTVALAASSVYQGGPAQLGGSLLTILIFLVLHMPLKPFLN
jgi:hypothetical protein